MSVMVLHDERPVARKQHDCQICGRRIEPGERYHRQRNIWEGEPFVFKECAHCDAMIAVFSTNPEWAWMVDEGFNEETVYEYEPRSIAEARLKVGWKRRWRHRDGSLWRVDEQETRS